MQSLTNFSYSLPLSKSLAKIHWDLCLDEDDEILLTRKEIYCLLLPSLSKRHCISANSSQSSSMFQILLSFFYSNALCRIWRCDNISHGII